jgi:hypothetical protein
MYKKVIKVTAVLFIMGFTASAQTITTGTLLKEMTDLARLPELTNANYKTVQYSSYDRSSVSATEPGWFANGDGFGNEVIPSFERVLQHPDTPGGIGRYVICDIRQPGAIVRTWSARIGGKILMYLDGSAKPVFEGTAEDFMWRFMEKMSPEGKVPDYNDTYRQVDAVYFPIPFAKSCRIEWTGSLKETHFYHINARLYPRGTKVRTFRPADMVTYAAIIKENHQLLGNADSSKLSQQDNRTKASVMVAPSSRSVLFTSKGSEAIEEFSIRLNGSNSKFAHRQTVMHIYFDSASVAQVQAPLGDFFGAAPGVNPFTSMPFSVLPDGTMICRFVMPYKKSVRIEIENFSNDSISVDAAIRKQPYTWKENMSMHFRAHWRINHGVTATNRLYPQDIPYLMAFGKGRVVGAATYLFNNSNIPSPGGSWWGEGDEKIFVDADKFPSFYGTGSEDYYNYSWSSNKIFYYPYCGQPRNDGPANRGFVTNFRWHVLDDIPFNDRLSFAMELIHHEAYLPDFVYGRMVYLYALPGYLNDLMQITKEDVRVIETPTWRPAARNRLTGYTFREAETLVANPANTSIEKGYIWSEGGLLMWKPQKKGEQLILRVPAINVANNANLTLMLASLPGGGKVSFHHNGKLIKVSGKEIIDLNNPYRKMLDGYATEKIPFKPAGDQLTLQYEGEAPGSKIGIDFIWLRD